MKKLSVLALLVCGMAFMGCDEDVIQTPGGGVDEDVCEGLSCDVCDGDGCIKKPSCKGKLCSECDGKKCIKDPAPEEVSVSVPKEGQGQTCPPPSRVAGVLDASIIDTSYIGYIGTSQCTPEQCLLGQYTVNFEEHYCPEDYPICSKTNKEGVYACLKPVDPISEEEIEGSRKIGQDPYANRQVDISSDPELFTPYTEVIIDVEMQNCKTSSGKIIQVDPSDDEYCGAVCGEAHDNDDLGANCMDYWDGRTCKHVGETFACACRTGSMCGGRCYETDSDATHCGVDCIDCTAIDANATCQAGACTLPNCGSGSRLAFNDESKKYECMTNSRTACAPSYMRLNSEAKDCTKILGAVNTECDTDGYCKVLSCADGYVLSNSGNECRDINGSRSVDDYLPVINGVGVRQISESECDKTVAYYQNGYCIPWITDCKNGFAVSNDKKACTNQNPGNRGRTIGQTTDRLSASDASRIIDAGASSINDGVDSPNSTSRYVGNHPDACEGNEYFYYEYCIILTCREGYTLSQDFKQCVVPGSNPPGVTDPTEDTTVTGGIRYVGSDGASKCTNEEYYMNPYCVPYINTCKDDQHISQDRQACLPNTPSACGPNTGWMGGTNEAYAQYAKKCGTNEICEQGNCRTTGIVTPPGTGVGGGGGTTPPISPCGEGMIVSQITGKCIPSVCKGVPGIKDGKEVNGRCVATSCVDGYGLSRDNNGACLPECKARCKCPTLMPGYTAGECMSFNGKPHVCEASTCGKGYTHIGYACIAEKYCCGSSCTNCDALGKSCSSNGVCQ